MSVEEETKDRHITYRVTDEERREIEKKAATLGLSVQEWCRRAALDQLPKSLPPIDRLLYEELARIHYLVGHGFRLLGAQSLTTSSWEGVQKAGAENWDKITDHLLQKQLEKKGGKS